MKIGKVVASVAVLTVSSLTLQATPWYQNPAVKSSVNLGAFDDGTDKSDPLYMDLSENDTYLAVNLSSSGNKFPAKIFKVADLASTGANASDLSFKTYQPTAGTSPIWKGGAVSEKWGMFVPGLSVAYSYYNVLNLAGVTPGLVKMDYQADGIDFDKAGRLYGNVYTADDGGLRGRIVRYTFSSLDGSAGGMVSDTKLMTSAETGLNRIRNEGVGVEWPRCRTAERELWYNSAQKGDDDMPSVMDYEEVKTSFPRVFDFVSGANGTVVTIVRAGRPVARLSPISVYRTTEADPSLKGKINCDLFADESADWESA